MLFQLLFLVLTYLICAVPFGLVLALVFAKTDIRQSGSKNIGATNVTRVVGKKLGFATLILDGLKGAIMVVIAKIIFADSSDLDLFLPLVAAIAVIGHIYPIYLKFKGGKGVATTLAVFFALDLQLGLGVGLTWLAVFALSRISSISSISAVFSSIIFSYYLQSSLDQVIVCCFLFLLVLLRHKENIIRLKEGKESAFKEKKSNAN